MLSSSDGSGHLTVQSCFAGSLACPDFGAQLRLQSSCIICECCGFEDASCRDLRPRKSHAHSFALCNHLAVNISETLDALDTGKAVVAYRGPAAMRDSGEFMSELAAWYV